MKKKLIVTVINSITETSMPYNEFVLRRYNNGELNQVIIAFEHFESRRVDTPEGLRVYYVGSKGQNIRKVINELMQESKDNDQVLIFHLHQPKSATVFFLRTTGLALRKNTLFTIHSLFDAYNIHNKLLSSFAFLLSKKCVFVSKASIKHYPSLLKKIKGKDAIVIRNGVDVKRTEKYKKCLTSNGSDNIRKKLIYVARVIPIKNHDFLIEVIKNLPELDLILVGQEDKNQELRKKINTLGLSERVEFKGVVPREKVFELLQTSDYYLSTSKVEGLPISVLEAMSIGLPVLISDIEPHCEIKEVCNEVIILPFKIKEWEEGLKKLMILDETEMGLLKENLQQSVLNHFSLNMMLNQYNDLYDLIKEGNK